MRQSEPGIDPNEVLPRNVLAERALIGALLWTTAEDDDALNELCGDLLPDDFAEPLNRALWAGMRRCQRRRGVLDVVLLSAEQGVSVGYACKLMLPWFASRLQVRHYAEIVRECARRRRQILEGMHLMRDGLGLERSATGAKPPNPAAAVVEL